MLRILKEEVELRELTRSIEKTRAGLEAAAVDTAVAALHRTQESLQQRTQAVIDQLEFLEMDQGKNYGKDKERLGRAERAMGDATRSLAKGDTGPVTIAAETEAIEALLETKRAAQGGGGGGGGSTPGGANPKAGAAGDASALLAVGEGKEAENRDVEQTTGRVRAGIPEEYRRGLDSYFGALEEP